MTALNVPTTSYLLKSGKDAAGLVEQLTARLAKRRSSAVLDPVVGKTALATRVVFDTADRRLRTAGLELGVESGPAGRSRLVLHEGEAATAIDATVAGRPRRRYLRGDLPPGRLRDRLAPIIEVRALLPLVEVRRRELPVAICNRDAKTVVRLVVADVWALSRTAEPPLRLAGRVDVAGVLGYPKQFAVVDTLLRDRLGLSEADQGVVDEAVQALGGDSAGVSGELHVELTRDEPAGQAAQRILSGLADLVEANLPGTLADLDPEFLHDVRVAVRRSRSVLREMKKVFDPAARSQQATALRWIQAVTGPTRDLDVQLEEWDELVAHLPSERRDDVEPAHALLVRQRAAAFRAMRTTLRGPEYRQRWAEWREFLAAAAAPPAAKKKTKRSAAAEPVRDLAGKRIESVYRRMVRDGRAIDDTSPAQALHDLRKRGKELRYLLELFGGLWPAKQVRPMVNALKGLQDVLGRHQDREVQAANLRAMAPDLATQDDGAHALLALGALIDRLQAEQHEARDQFAERFSAFRGLKAPT
jgi:CHAD domain-containing protein